MKKVILLFIFLFACNQRTPQQQASKDSANAVKESMDHIDQSLVKFATNAAKGNNKEIELGKIAQQNAEYERIKDFAARMVKEHIAANEALQQASYNSGVTLPSGADNDIASFSEKKGPAFDKAYIKEMVDEHQKILELLDKASHQLKDTALKNYAISMLPKVKGHVEEARVLLEDVRKQYRPEQGRDAHIK